MILCMRHISLNAIPTDCDLRIRTCECQIMYHLNTFFPIHFVNRNETESYTVQVEIEVSVYQNSYTECFRDNERKITSHQSEMTYLLCEQRTHTALVIHNDLRSLSSPSTASQRQRRLSVRRSFILMRCNCICELFIYL